MKFTGPKARLTLGFLTALLLATPFYIRATFAQQPQFNVTQYRAGFDGETLTVGNVSKALTASIYNPTITDVPSSQSRADYAYITVEVDSIRWWPCTGTNCTIGAPTATAGHLVTLGSSLTIWGYANIQNFRMIRVTNSATVQISYYRFATNTP